HQPREEDHDRGLRQIIEDDRQQPENCVGAAQLCRRPDPRGSDDVHDLHQDQVDESELFTEPGTPDLDLGYALNCLLSGQGCKTLMMTAKRDALACTSRSAPLGYRP